MLEKKKDKIGRQKENKNAIKLPKTKRIGRKTKLKDKKINNAEILKRKMKNK